MNVFFSTSSSKDLAAKVFFRARKPFLRSVARVGNTELASEWVARRAKWLKPWKQGPTVLCVARPHFVKDIEQLRHRTNLNFILISNGQLEWLQRAWTPPHICEQTRYATCTGEDVEAARQRTEEFATKFLLKLSRQTRISAVMSANIDYWQDDSIRRACVKLGIPFLVLAREHYIIPSTISRCSNRFKNFQYKYQGTGVAVFGESSRQMLITSGACTPEQTWVTGAPRLDPWREVMATDRSASNVVTLLSYSAPEYYATQNFREALGAFARVSRAMQQRNVRFVVKCKNLPDKMRIQSLLADYPGHQLELTVNMPMYDLLPASRLIFGFNSLSVLEGLFTNAVLAIPYWGETYREQHELMFDPEEPLSRVTFRFIESVEMLEQLIQATVSEPAMPADRSVRIEALQKYFHFPTDRTCSSLVADYVYHYIKEAV